MKNLILVIGILTFSGILTKLQACSIRSKGSLRFPANFTFGVSTSAFQIEGGWDEDGKGVSVWDDFTHTNPDRVIDGSNADVAADSYHRFDEDLKALKYLKVNFYRFSISWARILPNGEASSRNQAGIHYYNDVINKLLANGITPMVTMLHFDMPLPIQKTGGFSSPLFIEYFVTFATELYKSFGDRVKDWITINEPWTICQLSYGDGLVPPGIKSSGVGDYICMDVMLKAHATAYHVYKSQFFKQQRGRVGISLDGPYFLAKSTDQDVFERAMQFNLGYLAHPIFSKCGGYPEVMVKNIALNSLKEGRIISRLPKLEGEWKELIRGSADFLGLNYYQSTLIERPTQLVGKSPSNARDMNVTTLGNVDDPPRCDPSGLEDILKWIRIEYDNVEVIVTENGWQDKGGLNDNDRISYLKTHIKAVLNAVNDGCNVTGYTYWSLFNNFEWTFGYSSKQFGLYSVNMTSPTRDRSPKKSAHYYRKILSSRKVPRN